MQKKRKFENLQNALDEFVRMSDVADLPYAENENINKNHNTKKEAQGPNTKR